MFERTDTEQPQISEDVRRRIMKEFLLQQETENKRIAAEIFRLEELADNGNKDAQAQLKQLRAYIKAQETTSGKSTTNRVAPEVALDKPNEFQKFMRTPVARIAKAVVYTVGEAPVFFGLYSPVDIINIAEAVAGQDITTGEKLDTIQRIYRGVIAGIPMPLPTGEIVPLLDLGVNMVKAWRQGNKRGVAEKLATVAAVTVAKKVRASRSTPQGAPTQSRQQPARA